MRATVAMGMCAALTLQGCVFVLSHSYSNTAVDPRPAISEADWTYGFLHLSEPLIENLVIDLTHKVEMQCAGGRMVNVQTKVTLREFIGLLQVYGVRLTAQCAESAIRG